jgi:hypothetical protein
MAVMVDKSAEEGGRWRRQAGASAPARSSFNHHAFWAFLATPFLAAGFLDAMVRVLPLLDGPV